MSKTLGKSTAFKKNSHQRAHQRDFLWKVPLVQKVLLLPSCLRNTRANSNSSNFTPAIGIICHCTTARHTTVMCPCLVLASKIHWTRWEKDNSMLSKKNAFFAGMLSNYQYWSFLSPFSQNFHIIWVLFPKTILHWKQEDRGKINQVTPQNTCIFAYWKECVGFTVVWKMSDKIWWKWRNSNPLYFSVSVFCSWSDVAD